MIGFRAFKALGFYGVRVEGLRVWGFRVLGDLGRVLICRSKTKKGSGFLAPCSDLQGSGLGLDLP